MPNPKLLLIDDVEALGRKGDVVSVKPGYARNFILPKKKGVVANKQTLRMQEKLQEERAKQALVDRQASEELATKLQGTILDITVKVDPEGHMYGSVTTADIAQLFADNGIEIEKRNVVLPHPIKELGTHNLSLRLKEGVMMPFVLNVNSDIPLPKKVKEVVREEPAQEEPTEK